MARPSLVRLSTLLVAWAVWEIAARSGAFYEGVIPGSSDVIASLASHLVDSAFYDHALRTIYEVVAGFVIASIVGMATGIALGAHRFADDATGPYLHGFAATPKIVFLPVLMLLVGAGVGAKIGMAAMSAFFPITIAVAAGMGDVNPVLVRVARAFKAGPWQLVRTVYLPSLVAPAVTGMRLGLGVAIIGTLLAEIKFSDRGLGHLAIHHYNHFKVADMYAVIVLTFGLAVAANALMGRIASKLVRQKPGAKLS